MSNGIREGLIKVFGITGIMVHGKPIYLKILITKMKIMVKNTMPLNTILVQEHP